MLHGYRTERTAVSGYLSEEKVQRIRAHSQIVDRTLCLLAKPNTAGRMPFNIWRRALRLRISEQLTRAAYPRVGIRGTYNIMCTIYSFPARSGRINIGWTQILLTICVRFTWISDYAGPKENSKGSRHGAVLFHRNLDPV